MSAPVPTPQRTKARGLLLLALVLVMGILMGASAMVLAHHFGFGPPPVPRRVHGGPPGMGAPPERAMGHLVRMLDLSEEQRAEVERILEERRDEIDTLMQSTHEEIRALLTPEQQERLDALHERRGERRGLGGPRGRRPRRGPPPVE